MRTDRELTLQSDFSSGNDHAFAHQLIESLWVSMYEEWKREKLIDSDADFVARAEQLRLDYMNGRIRDPNPSASAPAEDVPHARQEDEQRAEVEESLCCVFMEAPRAVMLFPCGHLPELLHTSPAVPHLLLSFLHCLNTVYRRLKTQGNCLRAHPYRECNFCYRESTIQCTLYTCWGLHTHSSSIISRFWISLILYQTIYVRV